MTPQIGNFDAGQIDPMSPREALPNGWYAMQIVASEVKQSKTSDGRYLQLELEVLEQFHPEFKGRKVWTRLNLWNRHTQAVEIAQRTLSAICRACGQMVVSDSDTLHHTPLAVRVKKRPAESQYGESNDVTGYDAMSARFQVGGGPPATQPHAAASAGGTPPWQRPRTND